MMNKTNRNFYYKTNSKEDNSVYLFNCPVCGFHPKVINITYLKNDDENANVQLINVEPNKQEVKHTLQSNINTDGEIVDENLCGKCGISGHIEEVSKKVLDILGMI